MNETESTYMPEDLPAEERAPELVADEPVADAPSDPVEAQQGDPVVTVLLRIALALIIIALATAGAMLLVLKGRHQAPRTTVERDVSTFEAAVREKPAVADNWAKLAYAYSEAGRDDDAIDTARRGREVTGEDLLWLAEADALRAARRYKEAVDAYDTAEKELLESLGNAQSEREQKGIFVDLSGDTMSLVYYGRGLAEQSIGQTDEAIADLKKAVGIAPTRAYMNVALGDVLLESGDASGAASAYRAALSFVPDFPEALAGLKRAEGK